MIWVVLYVTRLNSLRVMLNQPAEEDLFPLAELFYSRSLCFVLQSNDIMFFPQGTLLLTKPDLHHILHQTQMHKPSKNPTLKKAIQLLNVCVEHSTQG